MRRFASLFLARSSRRTWLSAAGLALMAGGLLVLQGQHSPPVQSQDMSDRNRIKAVRSVPAPTGLRAPGAPQSLVEVEVTSNREFPVRNARVVLRIGNQEFLYSRYPSDGSLHTLIFELLPKDWAGVKNGERVLVYYGERGPNATFPAPPAGARAAQPLSATDVWDFGKLDKSAFGK